MLSNSKNFLKMETILFYLWVSTNSLIFLRIQNCLQLNLRLKIKFRTIRWMRIYWNSLITNMTIWLKKEIKRWSNLQVKELRICWEILLVVMNRKFKISQMVKTSKEYKEKSQDVHSCREVKNNTKSSKAPERSINLDRKPASLEKFKPKPIHSSPQWPSTTNKEKAPNS